MFICVDIICLEMFIRVGTFSASEFPAMWESCLFVLACSFVLRIFPKEQHK